MEEGYKRPVPVSPKSHAHIRENEPAEEAMLSQSQLAIDGKHRSLSLAPLDFKSTESKLGGENCSFSYCVNLYNEAICSKYFLLGRKKSLI